MRKCVTTVGTMVIVGLILSLSNQLTHGQNPDPNFAAMRKLDLRNRYVIPASPAAASLGTHGDVNVSHHIGALSYSLPLASIGDADLNWSFGISYEGSGVKVAELPSQVGQGWALQGTGVITRTVQGFPDDSLNYYKAAKHWNTSTTPNGNLLLENDFLDSVSRGFIETQPDIYTFNFGAYSGSFYVTQAKKIFMKDSTDLRITPSFEPTGNIRSFQIVDAGGFIYNFTIVEQTKSVMNKNQAATTFNYNSAWYLKEVLHPNNTAKITFQYDSVTTIFTHFTSDWPASRTRTPEYLICGNNVCGDLFSDASFSDPLTLAPEITKRRFINAAIFFLGTRMVEKITFTNANDNCAHAYNVASSNKCNKGNFTIFLNKPSRDGSHDGVFSVRS